MNTPLPASRQRRCLQFLIGCAALLVLTNAACCSALAQLPTIELTSLSPACGQLGSTVKLQPRGARLEEAQQLTFSVDGLTITPQTTTPRLLSDEPVRTGVFDVVLGQDVPRGPVDVRVLGRFGLSNPRRFVITSKAVEVAGSEHTQWATPRHLSGTTIVVDQCYPKQFNYFTIALPAGASLNCAAYAQQIDSKASLTMLLLDPAGHELEHARSIGAWPAELQYQAKEAGDYRLVVHDSLYQGGSDYPFLLEAVVGSTDGSPVQLELDELLRPRMGEPRPPAITLAASDTPPSALATAAEPQSAAEPRTLPATIQGSFHDAATSDFDFNAQAQTQLSLCLLSSQFDQLTDPSLVLYQLDTSAEGAPSLKQLAEQDDRGGLGDPSMRIRRFDPSLLWTAPADGTYRISLRDNQTGQRPADARQFLLHIAPADPGFALLAYRSFPSNNPATARHFGSNLMRGGTESVRVIALRRDGYNEPIEVSIQNLPPTIQCPPAIIPAGGVEAELILRAAEDADGWQSRLDIVGRPLADGAASAVVATSGTVVWPASPTHNSVQSRRSDQLAVALNPQDLAPLLVELGEGAVIEVAQGAKVSLPIKATRRAGGQAECVVRPKDLPPKVTAPETKIPGDQSQAAAELTAAADAPPGEYTCWMQTETKLKWQPNPQALQREEAYLAQLKTALEGSADPAEKAKLEAALPAVNARIEELKKQTAEQEFTVWLPSTPQRIRVVAAAK